MGESEQDEDRYYTIPKSHLAHIIRPRLESILSQVSQRLSESGFDRVAGRSVILTGGASQLTGMRDMVHSVLGRQVRFGRPRSVSGLADTAISPTFATTAGLLRYAAMAPAEMGDVKPPEQPIWRKNKIARLGQWFSLNF